MACCRGLGITLLKSLPSHKALMHNASKLLAKPEIHPMAPSLLDHLLVCAAVSRVFKKLIFTLTVLLRDQEPISFL
jgi:hypothetical protein